MFDLEMLREMGFCHGIENYSRHLTGGAPGEPPPTLIDYFPRRFSAGRRREPPDACRRCAAMFNGDRARKQTLVELRLSACRRRSTTGR